MALFISSIITSSLNPEIEKRKFPFINFSEIPSIHNPKHETKDDLKDAYILNNSKYTPYLDSILNEIKSFVNHSESEQRISFETFNYSSNLIDNLYSNSLTKINIENVYTSSSGSLLIDWEKENGDVFSLEINNDKMGYFIEDNNIDIKMVESTLINDTSILELNCDLQDYLN